MVRKIKKRSKPQNKSKYKILSLVVLLFIACEVTIIFSLSNTFSLPPIPNLFSQLSVTRPTIVPTSTPIPTPNPTPVLPGWKTYVNPSSNPPFFIQYPSSLTPYASVSDRSINVTFYTKPESGFRFYVTWGAEKDNNDHLYAFISIFSHDFFTKPVGTISNTINGITYTSVKDSEENFHGDPAVTFTYVQPGIIQEGSNVTGFMIKHNNMYYDIYYNADDAPTDNAQTDAEIFRQISHSFTFYNN